MNYKKLLENAVTANIDEKTQKAVDNRAAVASTPLAVGDTIGFTGASKVIDVLGNSVRMLFGARVARKGEAITDESDGIQVSCVSFGRQVRNPQTGTITTPASVAEENGLPTNKLAFNAIKNLSVGEMPDYVKGKYFQVVAMKQVASVRADGQPRLNANGEPIFQTVYAINEL